MPPIEQQNRNQRAILWEADGFDGFGQPKVDASVEIDVRWEERRSESVDANGNPIAVDAVVIVDREITVDSIMWLGTLADVPTTPTNLKRVAVYEEVPDLKNRHIQRAVLLVKHGDTLPTLNS